MKTYLVSAFIFTLTTTAVFADSRSQQKLQLAENGIVSTDASGDAQTTVIDANGNLKMVPANPSTKDNTSSATQRGSMPTSQAENLPANDVGKPEAIPSTNNTGDVVQPSNLPAGSGNSIPPSTPSPREQPKASSDAVPPLPSKAP